MALTQITDYLGVEDALRARVELELAASAPTLRVLTAPDLQTSKEAGQPTPSVHLIYHGDSRVDALAAGRASDVTQVWLAVIVVENVNRIQSGEGAREAAGPLMRSVQKALMGWSPADGYSAMEQTRSPYAATYRKGRAYYTLAFQTTVQMRSY